MDEFFRSMGFWGTISFLIICSITILGFALSIKDCIERKKGNKGNVS